MIRYQEAGYDDMYIQYMGEGYWDKTVSGNNTVLETWKKKAEYNETQINTYLAAHGGNATHYGIMQKQQKG